MSDSLNIPNTTLEKIIALKNTCEIKIALAALRKINGYSKDTDKLSFSQFKKITGMSQTSVSSGIKSCITNDILIREKCGASFVYKFNNQLVQSLDQVVQSLDQSSPNNGLVVQSLDQSKVCTSPKIGLPLNQKHENGPLKVVQSLDTQYIYNNNIKGEEGEDPLKHPLAVVPKQTVEEGEKQLSRVLGITSSKPTRNLAMERPLAHAWQVAYRSKFNEGYAWIKSVDDRGVKILEGCGVAIEEIIHVAKGMWSQPRDFDYNRSKSLGKFADKFNEFRSKVGALKPRESGATGCFRSEVA